MLTSLAPRHNAPGKHMDKKHLRQAILKRRRALSPDQVAEASRLVLDRLRSMDFWDTAREVLLYSAFKGEIDTSPLFAELWSRGGRVLLPRCRADGQADLDVACLTCLEELAPGAYGIAEPHPGRCAALAAVAPDMAFVPGIAFDRRGGRLGFGRGYYDRLLAGPGLAKTLLVGLAHKFQVLPELPQDPWDRPVHVIFTPEETIWPSP